eukprot:2608614-Alexandrium_andersonii.AAC.1
MRWLRRWQCFQSSPFPPPHRGAATPRTTRKAHPARAGGTFRVVSGARQRRSSRGARGGSSTP